MFYQQPLGRGLVKLRVADEPIVEHFVDSNFCTDNNKYQLCVYMYILVGCAYIHICICLYIYTYVYLYIYGFIDS